MSPLATPADSVGARWGRRLLIGLVWVYAVLLVAAPVVALVAGAFREGLGAIGAALLGLALC